MIFGGLFISWISLGPMLGLGLYKNVAGLILGIFGILGLLMLSLGVFTLAKRNRLVIMLDDTGIRIPTGNVFRPGIGFIPRDSIAAISKHESMKGRLIEISLKGGQRVFIQARHYCELDQFLKYCRAHRLTA
ncbi:MAG: hypothetical protein C5B50_04270 [Verrucomicrobia bacterium]|nr:MAG: hypothetical protein C5B50_04270 [Verrucomicrobiota bacterium]